MRLITFPVSSEGIPAFSGWPNLTESVPHEGDWYAVLTGKEAGFFVLDVDRKNGKDGLETLKTLGELPKTYTVRTKSGGLHFYFKHPGTLVKTTAGVIGSGLDIRGDKNGFVFGETCPGYSVECDSEIANAPPWLLELIVKEPEQTEVTVTVIPIDKEHPDYDRRLELGRKHLKECPPAISGQGGHSVTLTAATYLTVRLQLSVDVAYGLLLEHYNDRCDPPWDTKELFRKVTEAAKNKLGMIPGIPSEDFCLGPKPETTTMVRQVRNLGHRYTFEIGTPVNGAPRKATLAEITADLCQCPDWSGVLQYDEFADKIIAVNPPLRLEAERSSVTDADLNAIRCWFEVVGGKLVSVDIMFAAVIAAAQMMSFHPVRDYLQSLPKTDPDYLESFAAYVFGPGLEPVQVEFIKKTLVCAVKRVFEPGCFVKNMVVLTGPQDAGKSTFCKKLFGQWFKEDISDLKQKDAVQELLGVWGVEMAEMDSISRAEIKTVKSFVSRATDKFRPSYGRSVIERRRQNIFIGTTNDEHFLHDSSGGTRFWPIEVPDNMPTDWDRNSVWSAAYQLYLSGYSSYLDTSELATKAEKIRENHNYVDPWTDNVEKKLIGLSRVSANQMLALLLPETNHKDGRAQVRVQNILKRVCGKSRRFGDDKTRYYIVPERFFMKDKTN